LKLTLAEAHALALKNQPQILASEANFHRADQLVNEARSAYYPSINGEITGSQANPNARIGAGFLTDSRLFNRFGYGLTASQLITDSGRTLNLVAQSKLQAESSRKDYQTARENVLLAVDQAYYNALLADALVRLAQQTVATRQTVVDQVSELTRNKLKSNVDLSFAQVNLSDAKLMLLRAQNQRQSANATLSQALGSDQSTVYQLQEEPVPASPPPSVDSMVAQAFQNRPELASLRLQREADLKLVNAERDLKKPTVSLNAVAGSLSYIQPGNANPDIPLGYEGVAVNVQVPVFNGHLFTARRKAAQYQLEATSQRVRDLQERIARDVRIAWAQANNAYQAIGASQELLRQANLALDLAQGRYNLGLSSIVELTQAQLAQTQAQVQILQAQYEYQQAHTGLRYALGGLQ
ncbi:MAG: TolC family protein, partial [Acidobacteriaceae bacterium]|nr:TolC family protein [Acidobacteriaceae bacterium]